ncbi:hypothetical protein NDK47_02300 [Brevibacillus ruminantium]|uniref:Uncharacterized protein n=1 Tax=Brevibacillus ruminantium TaxID=2950604 RepID=A0ABY4WMN5_9BACL|nr:hypothetical protein [Brevibacillus ruminantium]USG68313.1 hypothetical protein NDK47_02300 [Brevibacillus ruminantium]
MTVTNHKLQVGSIQVNDVFRASLILIGDTDVMTCSMVFDTPADSLIFSPEIPIVPVKRGCAARRCRIGEPDPRE